MVRTYRKSDGKYKGRKPNAKAKADQVMQMITEGKKKRHIAAELNISERSVFRIANIRSATIP